MSYFEGLATKSCPVRNCQGSTYVQGESFCMNHVSTPVKQTTVLDFCVSVYMSADTVFRFTCLELTVDCLGVNCVNSRTSHGTYNTGFRGQV